MDQNKTEAWWSLLIGIACFNLGMWVILYWNWSEFKDPNGYIHKHLYLSGIYTLACAFRSFWPRIDLERYCLVDSMVSSMVFGRTAATFAEVSFAVQMMLFLEELGIHTHQSWIVAYAPWVVVSLSIAQIFCWSSVISLNHWGHWIEESIWGLTFLYIGGVITWCLPLLEDSWFWIGVFGITICSIYVLFMGLVDVPMYYHRWQKGRLEGKTGLSVRVGFKDAFFHQNICSAFSKTNQFHYGLCQAKVAAKMQFLSCT